MKFIIGFLFGLTIGASIGLAFAPAHGARTRAMVMDRMREKSHGSPMDETMEEMKEQFE